MIYQDAGTTYTKIIEYNSSDLSGKCGEYLIKSVENKNYYIIPSALLKTLDLNANKCCGHMASASENEIIALANGCKDIIDKNALVLDLGSRDSKWIRFKSSKFQDMDWNTSCASSTGATVEMLLKFYDVKLDELYFNEEKYAVTCGIFGLEKIMDDISNGIKPNDAISKFIHGIAYNAWKFAKEPEKLYLSGGFCENDCFVKSLEYYCEIVPLGRFVLCEGLLNIDLKEVLNGV